MKSKESVEYGEQDKALLRLWRFTLARGLVNLPEPEKIIIININYMSFYMAFTVLCIILLHTQESLKFAASESQNSRTGN